MAIYRFLVPIIATFLISIEFSHAQVDSEKVGIGALITTSGTMGASASFTKPSSECFGNICDIDFAEIYFAGSLNGFKSDGQRYTNIGEKQFPDDIEEEFYHYRHYGLSIGKHVSDTILLFATMGISEKYLIQNRYDDYTILGENGKYHSYIKRGLSSTLGQALKRGRIETILH